MAVSCMRSASGDNYRYISFIVDFYRASLTYLLSCTVSEI